MGSLLFLVLGRASAGTNEVGKKYLEEMKGKPGVVTLPSGLMYKVLQECTGEDHPTVDSPCECYYAGTTLALPPKLTKHPTTLRNLTRNGMISIQGTSVEARPHSHRTR